MRKIHGKPLEQVAQVNEPFSRNDGHRVGNGKAAGKSLTQAVKEAERSAAKCNEVLVEVRELAREVRDMQADVLARVRRATVAVWVLLVLLAVALTMVLLTP